MYELTYTMRAVCHDGIEREFVHKGFFATHALLDYWLEQWTGDNFKYFTTTEQKYANMQATRLAWDDLPLFSVCWFGKQQHHYDFKGEE